MPHERKLMRDAAVAQLLGATSAGSRVTSTRMPPPQTATLPSIGVYTDDEVTDEASKHSAPRELKRRALVAVEAWVAVPAGGAIDDAFDAIALQIETAMDANIYLAGTAFESVLASTEMGIDMSGARPMGCVKLTYEVDYHSDLRVTAPTDIFDAATTKYSQNNAQAPADQAQDIVLNINQEP